MIKVIAILTIICMLLGAAVGAGIYFYKDSDSSSDSSSNDSSNNSNVDNSLDSSSSSTGDSSSDMGSGVAGESSSGVHGLDDSGGTTSSRGGLTGPPPPPAPGEYTELASSAKPVCDPALCAGDKVLKGTNKKGTTIDECCRDKACEVDWDPDAGGDPEQCRADGMIFDEDIPNPDGKTNAECCKEDTTSYSKWCVQEVAYKADGTTEKTKSPNPDSGSARDLMPSGGDGRGKTDRIVSKIAGGTRLFEFGSNKAIALRDCKKKCDSISECHGFWLQNNGRCFPRKALNANELTTGYEKNMVHEENIPDAGGEFYIKSTFVPSNLRKQTINGEIKVAGIDEEFCPLNYISIYGSEKWGAGYTNKHVMPNKVEGSFKASNGSTCFGPGGTKDGVQLSSYVNSNVPIFNSCSKLCNKYDDCGGFWVDYTTDDRYARCHEETTGHRKERCEDGEIMEDGHGGHRLHARNRGWKWFSKPNGVDAMRNKIGRCCLKGDIDDPSGSYMSQPAQLSGAYFVRVRDGVMGDRPWRKSINSPK